MDHAHYITQIKRLEKEAEKCVDDDSRMEILNLKQSYGNNGAGATTERTIQIPDDIGPKAIAGTKTKSLKMVK